jgi:hypothetical protein
MLVSLSIYLSVADYLKPLNGRFWNGAGAIITFLAVAMALILFVQTASVPHG